MKHTLSLFTLFSTFLISSSSFSMLLLKRPSYIQTVKTTRTHPLRTYYKTNPYYTVVEKMGQSCHQAYQQKKDRCSHDLCCRNAFPNDRIDEQVQDAVFKKTTREKLIDITQKSTQELDILDSYAKYTFLIYDPHNWSDFCETLQFIIFKAECICKQMRMISHDPEMSHSELMRWLRSDDNRMGKESHILHYKLIEQNQRIVASTEEEARKEIQETQKELLEKLIPIP